MKVLALAAWGLLFACKVKPSEEPGTAGSTQPQQSLFCSSAYPNGVAQDDPPNSPLLEVSLDAGGFETHWSIGFSRAASALGSGTKFRILDKYEDDGLPHLIVEPVVNPSGQEVNVKVSGREDVSMLATADGGADVRILFTFSHAGSYEYPMALHEAAAEQVALHVIGGWTCAGDTAVPTRSF